MRYSLAWLAVSTLLLQPGSVGAQGCDGVLVPTSVEQKEDQTTAYAYLMTITKEQFEEMKKGGGGGLSIPIVSSLVSLSANWSEFQSRRETVKTHEQINFSSNEARWFLTSYLSEPAIKAWLACKTGGGVSLVPRNVLAKSFGLRVEWAPPPGFPPTNVVLSVKGDGASIDGQQQIVTTFATQMNPTYLVVRDADAETRVIVNVANGAYSDELVVAPVRNTKPPRNYRLRVTLSTKTPYTTIQTIDSTSRFEFEQNVDKSGIGTGALEPKRIYMEIPHDGKTRSVTAEIVSPSPYARLRAQTDVPKHGRVYMTDQFGRTWNLDHTQDEQGKVIDLLK